MVRALVCACALSFCVAAIAAEGDLRARGEKLFADQKCGACHAIAGKGNPDGPLDEVGSKLSAGDIRAWLLETKRMARSTNATFRRHRENNMKEYNNLPKEDIDALVAYLSSLKKK